MANSHSIFSQSINLTLQEAYTKLKSLFSAEENQAWEMTWARTMRAIANYRKDENQNSLSIFVVKSESSETRDRNCDVNFTIINSAISVAKKQATLTVMAAEMIKCMPKAIKELNHDLELFLKSDLDVDRQKKYQDAVTVLSKIATCLPENQHDQVTHTPDK